MGHLIDVSLDPVLGIYVPSRVLMLCWSKLAPLPETSQGSQYSTVFTFTLPFVAFSSPTSWEIPPSWPGTAPFSLLSSNATKIPSLRWRLALERKDVRSSFFLLRLPWHPHFTAIFFSDMPLPHCFGCSLLSISVLRIPTRKFSSRDIVLRFPRKSVRRFPLPSLSHFVFCVQFNRQETFSCSLLGTHQLPCVFLFDVLSTSMCQSSASVIRPCARISLGAFIHDVVLVFSERLCFCI